MKDKEIINSDLYWNTRFTENWETCEGPMQSRFFSTIAIKHLPRWLIEQFKREPLTLADWGCAQGDGSDVWASYINAQYITGVDFSSVAVEQASQRYPAIRFLNEDWLADGHDQQEAFDVVFSSNTLEHFHKPYDALHAICGRARKAIILALPYKELERIDEHFFSFLPENIPLVLRNGFRLAWSKVVDCRSLPNTLWGGDQIIIVYVNPDWVDSLGLTLSDCHIEQSDMGTEIGRLNTSMVEHDGQIASLTQAVAERDGQIVSLNQAVVEREGQIANLNQAVVKHKTQITNLNKALAVHDKQIAEAVDRLHVQEEIANTYKADVDKFYAQLNAILQSRSWRLTRPLRVIARLIRYRGFTTADRAAVIEKMRVLGQSLRLPLWLRAHLRSVFLTVGKSAHCTLIMPMPPSVMPLSDVNKYEHIERDINQLEEGEVVIGAQPMRAACCALETGLVSVILPVYNQASMLQDSIESVLNQTYENFELIILNDGSTDNVDKVLEKYLDHPKVRIYVQTNQKLPKALSNAFDLARGEFWTWTSADNLMEPRQLEILVARLRSNPTLGMVYADYYAIDDRGQLLKDTTWRAHNRPDIVSGEIRLPHTTNSLNVVQDNFIGPCFMYRGWIGRVLGEYDPIQGIEDYDYWMRINAFFSIQHLGTDDILYRYRVHDNTLNARAVQEKILEKVQNLLQYEKERAAFYQKPLEFFADKIAAEWLAMAGVGRERIHPISFVEKTASLFDKCCVIVASAATLCESLDLPRQQKHMPLIILFKDKKITPYDLACFLRQPGILAVVNDPLTAWRVRVVAQIPLIDASSQEAIKAIDAFAKNWVFYELTRDLKTRIRSVPTPFITESSCKNILLQADNFIQGGMENVMIDLCHMLVKERFNLRILVLGKRGEAVDKAIEQGLKVDVFEETMDSGEYLNYIVRHGIGVINAHYSVYGADIAHEIGIPFVETIHNSYVWFDPATIEQYRKSDKYISRYTCVSLTAAKYTDYVLGLDVSKITVIPNGIDTSIFAGFDPQQERELLRKKWGVSESDTVFLNVASILAAKAQLPLVKAFSAIVQRRPNSRLVLLGAVMDEAYEQKIREFVKHSGLERHVIFAGYNRDVGHYYHAADVFVLPSFWEGWSLSFGEALYVGMPIVSTSVGAALEFAYIENVILVEPPFGDITNLNCLNLPNFAYGEDEQFIVRLEGAMGKSLELRRVCPSDKFCKQLDRFNAYQSYLELFKSIHVSIQSPFPLPRVGAGMVGAGSYQGKYYFSAPLILREHGKRKALLAAFQVFDHQSLAQSFGGGERYILELANLLAMLGIEPTIIQPVEKSDVKELSYYGYRVILVPGNTLHLGFLVNFNAKLCSISANYDHLIYFTPEAAAPFVREDSLVISHGIWFDHMQIDKSEEWWGLLHNAFVMPPYMVSVDTNTINFIRCMWPDAAGRVSFIPNFFDSKIFRPDKHRQTHKVPKILFPRRPHLLRGVELFGKIVEGIRHDAEIIWLGKGDEASNEIINNVCENDSRCISLAADFQNMRKYYNDADIVVIPTIACEGTSLSCIEALACGCAVVSSHVGGLSNLIIDGYNGLLVDPDATEIASAISLLIENPDLRERISKRAVESCRAFSLDRWREKWVAKLTDMGWIGLVQKDYWERNKKQVGFSSDVNEVHPVSDRWVIVTRNALHGGVESLIREESIGLNADVIVCEGLDRRDTVPFMYRRADNPETLKGYLQLYDKVIYHWLPDWAVDAIAESGKSSVEFVHRSDTMESDKTKPTALITHSDFLATHIAETTGRPCAVAPHPINCSLFFPPKKHGNKIGALCNYSHLKGIDTLLRAWKHMPADVIKDLELTFYGDGYRDEFVSLADELEVSATFNKPTLSPWETLKDYRLFVLPSRMEGLPVAILEALAMNIPVISSSLPGMVEFNRLAVSRGFEPPLITVPVDDEQALTRSIASTLQFMPGTDTASYIQKYYTLESHCQAITGVLTHHLSVLIS